jgi:hypothetical protein
MDSIVNDSDINVLKENYNYYFWSILAVGVVLVSMNILKNYRHYLTPIKVITKSNYLFIRLMKYCLLFLYTFIYSCPENK